MRGVNAKCRWEKNKIGCCCKRPFATQVSVANRLKRCYLRRIPFALMLVVMMTRMSRWQWWWCQCTFAPIAPQKDWRDIRWVVNLFPSKWDGGDLRLLRWQFDICSNSGSDLVDGPQSEQTLKYHTCIAKRSTYTISDVLICRTWGQKTMTNKLKRKQ